MATFDDYIGGPSQGQNGRPTGPGQSLTSNLKGFEPPSEAARADMEERGRTYGMVGMAPDGSALEVEFDPYPPKAGEGSFSLGRVQFSLPAPLQRLLCNSNILLFFVSPAQPTPSNPPSLIRIDLTQPSHVDTIHLPLPSLFSSPSPPITRAQPNGSSPNGAVQLRATVEGMHADPTGRHLLLSLSTGENYYVSLAPSTLATHASAHAAAMQRAGPNSPLPGPSPAIRPLPKLRGAVITAVGWHPSSYTNPTPVSTTKEILLGTRAGQLLTAVFNDPTTPDAPVDSASAAFAAAFNRSDRSSVERNVKLVWSAGNGEGLTGVKWEMWTGSGVGGGATKARRKVGVLVTTSAGRLYQFGDTVGVNQGGKEEEGVLEGVFRSFGGAAGNLPKSLELPSSPTTAPSPTTSLHTFSPLRPSSSSPQLLSPTIAAWLHPTGIFHGTFSYPQLSPGDGWLENGTLVPFPASTSPDPVLGILLLEWHFVLLLPTRVVVVRRLDDKIVYQESLDLRVGEKVVGLTEDVEMGTFWVFTEGSIFELVVRDEGREVWKVFLKRGSWEMALKVAPNGAARDTVLANQGDALLASRKFIPAAQTYARSSTASFEQVVLSFIDADQPDALRYYLVSRLERLKRSELTQRCMIATWLVEIYLGKLDELEDLEAAVADEGPGSGDENGDGSGSGGERENIQVERGLIEEELKAFLKTYRTNLDRQTTFDLIASHGRTQIMLQYASLIGDHIRIIQHHLEHADWRNALLALSTQENLDLYYRFAPVLIRELPGETVEAFRRMPGLEVKRLVPGLIGALGVGGKGKGKAREGKEVGRVKVVEYLRWAVEEMDETAVPVHNALLTLYATMPADGEGQLVRWLGATPDNPLTGKPYYDLDYALRLCKANGKLQACGLIYSKMGLYESSVDLALATGDLELAKMNADRVDDDPLLKKKLWLKIAKYVVHDKNDIKTAMQFLESTSDLLKIEDILPFFPDFVVIDDFKEDICDALEGYSAHIDHLKDEMDEATRTADAIKADISELANRFIVIDQGDACNSCNYPLLTRQFYVFPCQHTFHADCLITEVTAHMPRTQLRRILTLQTKLAQAAQRTAAAGMGNGSAAVGLENTLLADSKKLALASVQGLDQVRKLIIPDALVGVIGEGVGAIGSGVGAIGGVLPIPGVGRRATLTSLGADDQPEPSVTPTASAADIGKTNEAVGALLGVSKRKTKEGKTMTEEDKWKEELDELLASKCVLCDLALNSLDKGFLEDGEVDI